MNKDIKDARTELDINPIEYIGFGLSKEDAEDIVSYNLSKI